MSKDVFVVFKGFVKVLFGSTFNKSFTIWSKKRFTHGLLGLTHLFLSNHSAVKRNSVVSVWERWKSGRSRPMEQPIRYKSSLL